MALPVSNSSKINVRIGSTPKVLVNQSNLTAAKKISDLTDVDVSAKEDGSLLIYDETQEKFVASRLLDKQEMNGGHF